MANDKNGLPDYIAKNIGKYSIDSLQLIIPMEYVNIHMSNLEVVTEPVLVYGSITGEFKSVGYDDIEDKPIYEKKQSHYINPSTNSGIYYKIIPNKGVFGNFKEQTECIHITLNSKMLGPDYFNGIDPYNLPALYELLIKDKVIDISFKKFCSSYILDTDVKQDNQYQTKDVRNEFKSVIQDKFSPNRKANNDKKLYLVKNSENIILPGQSRKQATLGCPFFKAYDKVEELINEHKEFINEYIPDVQYISKGTITRFEYTMKNKSMLSKYYPKFKDTKGMIKILDFAQTPQHEHKQAQKSVLNQYLNIENAVKEIKNEIRERADSILIAFNLAFKFTPVKSFENIWSVFVEQAINAGFSICSLKKHKSKFKAYYVARTGNDTNEYPETEILKSILGND